MDTSIIVHGKRFKVYMPYEEVESYIDDCAEKINRDYKDSKDVPIILSVLNGAMLFTAELLKRLTFDCELMSIKLKSYTGTLSTGSVKMPMGLTGDVRGRRVIIVEDIVDTGNTMVFLKDLLEKEGAKDVKIATMLLKPEVFDKDIKLDYVAKEIPNKFILGFGLDYDEIGRNKKDIYVIDE